ncbi:amino acid ABC transporter permease [Actinomadura luteofluorescens]|uniref:Polar amino acid transport system permease protein n=1 Tax=Actinomadura luteofluorescens TaxID=46163 RepID=A0A7Y9EBB1_9ACTN|nr:amino acid ABC transporter permease [Actinomadura luteofluorescens]NYD44638.1 polar amino acid transport system permease protein [Actinomadura luteofluorescens]
MIHALEVMAAGIRQTVMITVTAFLLGAVAGLPLAMLRRSAWAVSRVCATVVVEVLRGVPPIAWLFIVYYAIGSGSVALSTFQAAVLGLGLIAAAHLCEAYRAGLDSVPGGQWQAVAALGLPPRAAYTRVILPQALVVVVPPMATFAIALLKESAVASVIGATDVAFFAVQQTQQDLNGLGNFAVAGAIYLALSVPLAAVARGVDGVLTRRMGLVR